MIEVLSGPPLVDFSVPYLASSSNCPAPARFIEGETALLFLSRYQDEWFVPALSYGARYPPDAVSLAELRSLVGLALLEQRAGAKEPSLKWKLEAVGHPVSRWDGLYELRHLGDEDEAFRREPPPLDQATLARVEEHFLLQPSADETFIQVLELLEGRKSFAVTQTAANIVEKVLRRPELPWWLADAVAHVERRLRPMTARGDRPIGNGPRHSSAEALRARWERLKEDHRLMVHTIVLRPSGPAPWGD